MLDTLATHRAALLLCGAVGGYLLVMLTSPVRDGTRCDVPISTPVTSFLPMPCLISRLPDQGQS